MKKFLFVICSALLSLAVHAQIQDPVEFKSELKKLANNEAEIIFTGEIEDGWHVYSTELGDGPTSATLNIEKINGVELIGKLMPVGKEVESYDQSFGMKVRYFESTAKFVQKLKLTGGAYQLEGYLQYGACNDENCLPPTDVTFSYSGAVAGASAKDKNDVAQKAEEQVVAVADNSFASSDLWKPVIKEMQSF